MIHQIVFDTAEILYRKGVRHVVLSPGSRNAPLTLSFSRHPKLKIFSIVDERSAGFIALGIAQNTNTPVVLCCTSGTALLNYLPAIAEAFYQGIPLIALSADRPPEWIDQRDGQTINQANAAANFVKGFYQMPVSLEHPDAAWEYNRKLNEAYNLSSNSKGPVHINVPFREPFYPDKDQKLKYSDEINIIETQPAQQVLHFTPELNTIWQQNKKKLIVVGQHEPEEDLEKELSVLAEKYNIPVVTDVISNVNNSSFIRYQDHFLSKLDDKQAEALKPELLITCGKSVISKSLKIYLRKYKPKHHWHFEETHQVADTFKSITRHFRSPLLPLIKSLPESQQSTSTFGDPLRANHFQAWKLLDEKASEKLSLIERSDFSEYKASYAVSKAIPKNFALHLANSMPVRYANLLRAIQPGVAVYCNRGTSGIDGTNGTAVGHALSSEKGVLLWTGDLSFFYDRNAFFHHHDLSNLRIVVMNNQGGGIFRLINGPKSLPELEGYFETRHQHSARFIAEEFGFDYFAAQDENSLDNGLKELFNGNQKKKILEIFTEPSKNEAVYNKIKNISYE